MEQNDEDFNIIERLRAFDRQTSVWFATRCAMRAFPHLRGKDVGLNSHGALIVLRCLITAAVQAELQLDRDHQIFERLFSASKTAESHLEDSNHFEIEVVDAAGLAAQSAFEEFYYDYSGSSALHARKAIPFSYSQIGEDLRNPNQWFPLWGSMERDEMLGRGLLAFFDDGLSSHGSQDWDFWKHWYASFVSGNPISWKLQLQVALIEDEIWASGTSAIAEEIRRVSIKLELSEHIEKLKGSANISLVGSSRHTIGGNNPPEDMQIEPQIVRETTIIWAAVDELKAETSSDAPDKSAVLRIIETLGQALKAILAWLAQKGDLSVDTLIKWGIPLGGAAVLANPKLVADVIEAAKAWVPFLP